MASNLPTKSFGSPAGGILLVEEYGSLGVALTSALRKFAPHHNVRIAHGLVDAEEAAALIRPELILLDLDPPPSGEILFLQRLKARHPEARVLVMAPGTSRELRAERGTAGAIQFIEKPFDLAEFGAAVQALLGPWTLPYARLSRGTIRDLHFVDLVHVKCLALGSGVVRLETDDGKSGAVYFRRGHICHAVAGTLTGIAAFEEIASWRASYLIETDLPPDISTTINSPWPDLLLRVARRLSEETKHQSSGTVARTGKKILIIDDTEMLLIFAADTLATADPTLQIITASTGAEGIRLAASAHPDLILLDYSLTDTTGDKVCHALLEEAETAQIPVLMMSGHLGELARTANNYKNVVASLPKPFLSGALIEEVERILAAGPLLKPSQMPASPTETSAPPATVLKMESQTAPSPNGHGGDDSFPSLSPTTAQEAPSSPTGKVLESSITEPAESVTTVERTAILATAPPSVAGQRLILRVGPTEVSVTLALDVVSMELTPSLKMEAATLQPSNPVISLKMTDQTKPHGVLPENGFRLDAIELLSDAKIDTMRLVPTHQPPELPAARSSFAVGGMRSTRINSHQNLQLTATKNESMRVLLTTQCDLLMVELSVAFEVIAVVLKARGANVILRNGTDGGGTLFALKGVELNPASELRALLIRAMT